MKILSRPPGDEFSMRIFIKLISSLRPPFNALYLWSSSISPCILLKDNTLSELTFRKELFEEINHSLVVINIRDNLTSKHFNPWINSKPDMIEYLEDMFKFYKDKKFILLTGIENLQSYIDLDNVKIVPTGGCITNHAKEYITLEPIIEKNLDSRYTFISLNRQLRQSRLVLVSLIYDFNLESHGLISCMFKDQVQEELEPILDWNFTLSQNYIYEKILRGWSRVKSSQLNINDDLDIYESNWNNNVYNFRKKLKNYYTNSFVELVSETSYTESCLYLTEKTLNSIYACNFPIFISSKNTVRFLRDIGLDVFDDIIDHSYDNIENPIDRIYTAVYNNLEILKNNKKTKKLWTKNRERFIQNIKFAKNQLYNFFSDRANIEFKKAQHEFRF